MALLAALVVVGAGAAGPVQGKAARTHVVRVQDIDFHPRRLTVARGDVVVWRFLDAATEHTVTSVGARRFRSSSFHTSGSHRVRFTRKGTYRYVCRVHPNMRGRVVVR